MLFQISLQHIQFLFCVVKGLMFNIDIEIKLLTCFSIIAFSYSACTTSSSACLASSSAWAFWRSTLAMARRFCCTAKLAYKRKGDTQICNIFITNKKPARFMMDLPGRRLTKTERETEMSKEKKEQIRWRWEWFDRNRVRGMVRVILRFYWEEKLGQFCLFREQKCFAWNCKRLLFYLFNRSVDVSIYFLNEILKVWKHVTDADTGTQESTGDEGERNCK